MGFPERLAALRKERGFTQKTLADKVDVRLPQIQRYENGTTQPTLDIIRKLAIALSVSADMLIFDTDERGPDDELKLQFEAICSLDPEDKKIVQAVLDSLILKHEAKRIMQRAS